MSLSRFTLPSIHHVLEGELHETIPKRPSVITILDYDQTDWSLSMPLTPPHANVGYIPSTSHLMKTIDLRDAEPIAKDDEEQFSFIVHFPDVDELENEVNTDVDARTMFKEKRPTTSRGFLHGSGHPLGSSCTNGSDKHDLSPLIMNAVRKVLPVKLAEALFRRISKH
ncbi:hypothetical protein GALMADRAFT_226251 [Galerina marginata CBS 339.88]|uniref:Uncharacterized protein n=1 Tax=Galerina marginata (strain CBS 339.88) TaxID=685588 RepID=A0A067SZX2_GALM3|nr:hypothetical protein GALMADRAFT_226251 [Galerina marginata CBS 339.88]